jgi:hypothetical protein
MGLGLNLGLHACKAGTLPLEPHLQSILFWLFWRWGLVIYLSRLALNSAGMTGMGHQSQLFSIEMMSYKLFF